MMGTVSGPTEAGLETGNGVIWGGGRRATGAREETAFWTMGEGVREPTGRLGAGLGSGARRAGLKSGSAVGLPAPPFNSRMS